MSNRFFDPHLAMGLRLNDINGIIRTFADLTIPHSEKDMLDAFGWMESELTETEQKIDRM